MQADRDRHGQLRRPQRVPVADPPVEALELPTEVRGDVPLLHLGHSERG